MKLCPSSRRKKRARIFEKRVLRRIRGRNKMETPA
jgi:hypothetical protein